MNYIGIDIGGTNLKAGLVDEDGRLLAVKTMKIREVSDPDALTDTLVALTRERDIPWVTFGKRSKKGHPHHPLYLRKDSTPEPFDVENYLDTCF